MKGNRRGFQSAIGLFLSFLPSLEKWQNPFKLYRNPRRSKKGSTDRYAGIHPSARNKTQECARRMAQRYA